MVGGDDVAPVGERSNGRFDTGGRMAALQTGYDPGQRTPAVEKRKQVAIQAAVQQRIEGLGNQERLLLADDVADQVRSEGGKLDAAAVRRRRSS